VSNRTRASTTPRATPAHRPPSSAWSSRIPSQSTAKVSRAAELIERFWLRDEYRIPPHAQLTGFVALVGRPRLPLIARVTVEQKTFSFRSVATEEQAMANVDLEAKVNADTPLATEALPLARPWSFSGTGSTHNKGRTGSGELQTHVCSGTVC